VEADSEGVGSEEGLGEEVEAVKEEVVETEVADLAGDSEEEDSEAVAKVVAARAGVADWEVAAEVGSVEDWAEEEVADPQTHKARHRCS
jgi:hypothetical protein